MSEKLFTEQEVQQRIVNAEVTYIKKAQIEHINATGKLLQEQSSQLGNVEDMCRRLPEQMNACKLGMEKENAIKFISRKEVEAMEERLDKRIDKVPEVVGEQIALMTTSLKTNQESTINKALNRILIYISVGFGAAVGIISLVMLLTDHVPIGTKATVNQTEEVHQHYKQKDKPPQPYITNKQAPPYG